MKTSLLKLLGPAFVAGVAYLDPGNVASNVVAGSRYGYLLVWVIVSANTIAWLVQYLSAKLGVITGCSLPEVIGQRLLSPWTRRLYWLQAEAVAMATDLAEVIGGAIALALLFDLPLLVGGIATGVVSLLLLMVQSRGARPFERIIITLMAVIAVGFCAGLLLRPPNLGATVRGLVPRFDGSGSVLIAASMVGATVMPHAVYVHSALTRDRFGQVAEGRGRAVVLRATRWDVTTAMVIAGSVNLGILLLAAGTIQGREVDESLEGAHAALSAAAGPAIGPLFAVGLLASGLASSSVGAYAGAEIMRGLLKLSVPLVVRRGITMIPALVVLALGLDPTWALVLSQVVLSFGIPFALIPLVVITAKRSLLGNAANRWYTTVLGALAATLLVTLNLLLLVQMSRG